MLLKKNIYEASSSTTMKRLLRRTLHRSVTIFNNVRQSTLSLSKGSVPRSVILLSKAWQFILSLSKDRTLHRSVTIFNNVRQSTLSSVYPELAEGSKGSVHRSVIPLGSSRSSKLTYNDE
jgi:hypothetical protein